MIEVFYIMEWCRKTKASLPWCSFIHSYTPYELCYIMQHEFDRPQEGAGIKAGFSSVCNSVLKEIPESKKDAYIIFY